MSNRRCAAKTCFNSLKTRHNLKFFPFPKDENICRQWAINCGRNDLLDKTPEQLSKFLLCAEHFESHWFLNKHKTSFIRTGHPVPTIFYNNLADFVPKSLKKICESKYDTAIKSGNKTFDYQLGTSETDDKKVFLLEVLNENEVDPLHLYNPDLVTENTQEATKARGCHKMCRLCACLVYENNLVSLFAHNKETQMLLQMISRFLPDKIQNDDGLPHHVCNLCITRLNNCNEIVESFLEADKKLRVLFEAQNKESYNLTYLHFQDENVINNKPESSASVDLLPALSEFLTVKADIEGKVNLKSVNDNLTDGDKEKTYKPSNLITTEELDAESFVNSSFRVQNSSQQTIKPFKEGCSDSESYQIFNEISDNLILHESQNINPNEQLNVCVETDLNCVSNEVQNSSDSDKIYKCQICTQRFETSDQQFIHEFTKHSIGKVEPDLVPSKHYKKRELHKCDKCNKIFNGLKPFRKHIKEYHIPAENICEFCGAHYKIKSQLDVHKRIHTNEKPFSCGTCQESFHFKKALRRHKRIHYEPKSLTCKVCNKTYNNRSALWRHEKTHSNSNNVLCYLCGKVLSNSQSLRVHMRTHSNDRPCSCPTCGKSFKDNMSVSKHMLMHTSEKKFSCDICGRAFYSKALVKQHKLSHSGVKPYTCEACGAAFNRLGNLNQHKKKHLNEMNPDGQTSQIKLTHECVVCSKRLKSELTLKYHLAKHTGEKKPFDCEVCGKRFIAVDPYRVHMRIHTGERPYECNLCEKTFRSSFTLKQHSALHKDEFPYPCPFCERQFKRLQSLVVHKRTHTGEKPHQCPLCGRAFAQKGDMLKHTKTHTRERSLKVDDKVVMEIEHITELALSDSEITNEFLIDMPIVEVETEIQPNEINVEMQPSMTADLQTNIDSQIQSVINSELDSTIESAIHSQLQSDIHSDIHSVIHSEI